MLLITILYAYALSRMQDGVGHPGIQMEAGERWKKFIYLEMTIVSDMLCGTMGIRCIIFTQRDTKLFAKCEIILET